MGHGVHHPRKDSVTRAVVFNACRTPSNKKGVRPLSFDRFRAAAKNCPLKAASSAVLIAALACTAPAPLPPASPPVAQVLVGPNHSAAHQRCLDYRAALGDDCRGAK